MGRTALWGGTMVVLMVDYLVGLLVCHTFNVGSLSYTPMLAIRWADAGDMLG